MDPNEIGGKLRRAREAQGNPSQEVVASAIGASQSTVDRIERGSWKRMPSALPRLAKYFGLRLEELDHSLVGIDTPVLPAVKLVGDRDIPVFGTAEAGGGILIMGNEPIDVTRRPAPLENVRDAYGVLITGDSMIPVLRPGHIALVNPHLPPVADEEVILQREDHGQRYGMVKTFLHQTNLNWRLRQWNKRADFSRPRKEWPICHLVVAKYSRR